MVVSQEMGTNQRFPSLSTLLLAFAVSIALPARTPAQGTTLVEPPAPLLPSNETLVQPTPELAVPDDSAELQAILKEDGVSRSEARVALSPGGGAKPAATGWVKAYQFGDATGAFAAYTYLRQGGRPEGGSTRNQVVTPAGERILLSGTSLLRAAVRQSPGSVNALLSQLEAGLPKVGGRKGLAPLLPTLLPRQSVDAAAARYALGPLSYQAEAGVLPAADLGWDKSVEVITAPVVGRAGRGTLTLLLYPTPEIAGDRGRAIEKMINDAGPGKYGTVKLRRVGPLVGMASGALTAEQAQALVGSLRLNQEVSFDQKLPLEFHAEVRKTASLLQNIAVLCGVLILAALLLGLFLGGARAGVRVLMGKPAASEPEFLTINLRDQPKALFRRQEDEGLPR